jgi:hypothetical protein
MPNEKYGKNHLVNKSQTDIYSVPESDWDDTTDEE